VVNAAVVHLLQAQHYLLEQEQCVLLFQKVHLVQVGLQWALVTILSYNNSVLRFFNYDVVDLHEKRAGRVLEGSVRGYLLVVLVGDLLLLLLLFVGLIHVERHVVHVIVVGSAGELGEVDDFDSNVLVLLGVETEEDLAVREAVEQAGVLVGVALLYSKLLGSHLLFSYYFNIINIRNI
jgi:hypothetical protein